MVTVIISEKEQYLIKEIQEFFMQNFIDCRVIVEKTYETLPFQKKPVAPKYENKCCMSYPLCKDCPHKIVM